MNKFAIHITDRPITTAFGSSFSMNETSLDTELPDVTKHIKENKNDVYNNSEIEKGEILLKNDMSSILKASGKTHAKGGIKVNLNDGDFIYSNYNKLALSQKEHKLYELKEGGSFAKGKNTPAEVLKRNIDTEDYNKMVALLQDDKKGDLISKKSAALMINKYQEVLGKVAYIQETKKNEQAPSFSNNTAPVYDTALKNEIKQQPQYMKKGGFIKKYLNGGLDCPEGYVWNGLQCVPNSLYIGASNMPINPYANQSINAGAYSKSPYDLATKGDKGYTLKERESYFNKVVDEANLLGANLQKGLNQKNIDAYHKFYKENYPDVINTVYGNKSIMTNNKTPNNFLDTWDDGYFQKDAIGVDGTEVYYKSIEERDAAMKKLGRIATKKNPNIFYDVNKVTANNIPTLFRTKIYNDSTIPSPISSPTTDVKKDVPPIKDPEKSSVDGKKQAINWQFTPWQQANLGWAALQAAKVERQFPYRPQVKSQLVDSQKLNPQQALNQSNNAVSLALKASQSLNPYLAGASSQNAIAQGMNQTASILGQYDEKNSQIANQQELANNQILNRDLEQNIAFDKEYYDATQDSYRNYRNMKDVANNSFINQANQYANQNQLLAYMQASLGPNAPYRINFQTGQYELTGQNPLNINTTNSQRETPYYNNMLEAIKKGLNSEVPAERINAIKEYNKLFNKTASPNMKAGGFVSKYRTIK